MNQKLLLRICKHLFIFFCFFPSQFLLPISVNSKLVKNAKPINIYDERNYGLKLPESNIANNFTLLSAGSQHTCGLTVTGGVKCWGFNDFGQLGDGSTNSSSIPVDVFGLTSGVIAIAAGGNHTCALTDGGGVKCWGYNFFSQTGADSCLYNFVSEPVDVEGLSSGVISIITGWTHSCALTEEGKVKCWGGGGFGELGDGSSSYNKRIPVDVIGLDTRVISITAGFAHTCAVTEEGGVKCWGYNNYGQLGDGTTNNRTSPVSVEGLTSGNLDVNAGTNHTCALNINGGVKCWGYNSVGSLGDGSDIDRSEPVNVSGMANGINKISAGGGQSCALTASGGVKCWGANSVGQLGDGTKINRYTPVDVVGLESGVQSVAAALSGAHTCALTLDGNIKCWGKNNFGQLGNGNIIQRSIPVDVYGYLNAIIEISTGESHTCVLTPNGGIKCWGDNYFSQLGDGTDVIRTAPVDVIGFLNDGSSITAGRSHTCALTKGGGVKCWGNNGNGQLGDGTNIRRNAPVNVLGLSNNVSSIGAGGSHTCAITINGGVKCWGYNYFGQLGDGTTTQSNTPVDVIGLSTDVIAIAVGEYHNCALTINGAVKCWGSNSYGQLGDGTKTDQASPVDVIGLDSDIIEITTGSGHSCSLSNSGAVNCWGNNEFGQLGDGGSLDQLMPTNVVGLDSGVVNIAAGGYHTCALIDEDGVRCWGANYYGQLGDGTLSNQYSPVDTIGLSDNVISIEGGEEHSCALTGVGRPKCWGSDHDGQLGTNLSMYSLMPVDMIENPKPILTTNYAAGKSGSFFSITGWNYPSQTQIGLRINGIDFPGIFDVNPTGSFILFIDTNLADNGIYFITDKEGQAKPTTIIVEDYVTTHNQEGGGEIVNIPSGLAILSKFSFLPIINR